jgi:hypothetical protein
MADRSLDTLRASDAERQLTSRRLQAACVEGYLTLEDFSERVGRALAAQTRGDLAELTHDLPAQVAPTPRAEPDRMVSPTLVVLSDVERSGVWRLPQSSSLVVALGSCKLDLRRATIGANLTTIDVRVVLGSLEVVVPHGVEVDLEASSILSSKTQRVSGPAIPDAPRIVITGHVLAGSLTVRDVPMAHDWQA